MSLTRCLCLVLIAICNDVVSADNLKSKRRVEQQMYINQSDTATYDWTQGTVPYYIESDDYDDIIIERIHLAMRAIESSSCVVFKEISMPPVVLKTLWLSIQNPNGVRECFHNIIQGEPSQAVLIIGYDCMSHRDILHALMHVLGFRDEVTHPQRDMYVRIMWNNIQIKYRSLFWMKTSNFPHKVMVEYDTTSVMHFHDRAYSVNGGATITALIPGLLISPSDKLSQLDIMKLRLAYGHECNKQKVGKLFETCQKALQSDYEQADDHIDDNIDDQEDDHSNITENSSEPTHSPQILPYKK